MGRPEIMRSGEVSLGDNPAGNEVDDKQTQPTDTFGSVPPGNRSDHGESEGGSEAGHSDDGDEGGDDPDKPIGKFADRAARERDESA